MVEYTRKNILSNMLWRFFERFGAQFITLVVTIVIARVLEPNLYGKVALISVVITVLQVFVDSGLGTALIQKESPDDLDYSSVFYVNMSLCFVSYALFYALVPLITSFYGTMDLVLAMRVSGLTIVLSGIKNVQQSYVMKNFMFKKFFFSTLAGTVVAGVVGVYMAYNGYGIWALVIQDLLNKTIDTAVLWITVPWRPRRMFSFERLSGLLSFGWKILASGLLVTCYNEARQLIIGKKYSTEDLAYYNQALRYPRFIVYNIDSAFDSVLFPTMSSVQSDAERVRAMVKRAIKTSSYIIMPIMMGMAVCADSLVSVLLTDKWLPTVPYIRIFCFTYAFFVIHTANLNAIKAIGKSDVFLKLEILKTVAGLGILLATMWNGVMIMAIGGVVNSFVSQIINSWPNKNYIDYSYIDQIRDIVPNIVLTLIMGAACFCVTFIRLDSVLVLIIQIITGVFVYWIGSIVLKNESFYYCINMVNSFLKKK